MFGKYTRIQFLQRDRHVALRQAGHPEEAAQKPAGPDGKVAPGKPIVDDHRRETVDSAVDRAHHGGE